MRWWSARRRLRGVLMVVFALLLSLGFSVFVAGEETVLRIATAVRPPTLDTQASPATVTFELALQMFDTLFAYDRNFALIPQLAETAELSEDQLVWRIGLRRGVLFHDGTEMKAEDVKASILRFRQVSPRGGSLDPINDIVVVDDYTIEIHTTTPILRFREYMALEDSYAVIMPAHVLLKADGQIKGMGELRVPEDYIGTGPFELVEWIPGERIVMVKSASYHPFTGLPASGFGGDREALVDKLIFLPTPEKSARWAALKAGEVDIAKDLPTRLYSELVADPELQPIIAEPREKLNLIINTTESSPFHDVLLRRAVQAALDNTAIMEAVTAGRPEFYNVDCGAPWFEEQVWYSDCGCTLGTFNQHDVARAKQLMEEAGYDGEPLILVSNNDYDSMYRASIVVLGQLREAGFNVTLEVYDWPTQSSIVWGSHEGWDLGYTTNGPRFDPLGWESYMGPAKVGYDNPEIQRLMAEQANEMDFDKRHAIWMEIQEILQYDVPYIWHGEFKTLQGAASSVEGYSAWVYAAARLWNVSLED